MVDLNSKMDCLGNFSLKNQGIPRFRGKSAKIREEFPKMRFLACESKNIGEDFPNNLVCPFRNGVFKTYFALNDLVLVDVECSIGF